MMELKLRIHGPSEYQGTASREIETAAMSVASPDMHNSCGSMWIHRPVLISVKRAAWLNNTSPDRPATAA